MIVEQAPLTGKLDGMREDFPVLDQYTHEYPRAYLDAAATSQKPTVVIEALQDYYCHYYANVHRGVYQLSEQATEALEAARIKVQRFIGARSPRERSSTGSRRGLKSVKRSLPERQRPARLFSAR